MKKTFIVSTAGGRLQGLCKLITSLKHYIDNDWDISICFQKYTEDDLYKAISFLNDNCKGKFTYIVMNELTGGHLSKVAILDNIKSDIYCSLDDDMEIIKGLTRYDEMAEILKRIKRIGLISANWRRTKEQVLKAPISYDIQYKKIVYTGGGMLFRDDVAEIIRNIPRKMYLFDNPLWSIYSYVNGYENARFLGSVCVHNVCTVGGRRRWIKEVDQKKHLPPAEWINAKKGKNPKEGSFDEYIMCGEDDVTELAKKLHRENIK